MARESASAPVHACMLPASARYRRPSALNYGTDVAGYRRPRALDHQTARTTHTSRALIGLPRARASADGANPIMKSTAMLMNLNLEFSCM